MHLDAFQISLKHNQKGTNQMDFLELAQSRRSIRNFTQQDVPQEHLIELIEAAQAAPSGGNRQPWHFYIIRDEPVKTRIMNESCNQDWILTAPVVIVVCADIKRSESRYSQRGRDLYCIQDTAAAVQNILLCAKSMGLGTCWCGAFDEEKLSEVLQLHKDMRPVAIIPVGYPVNEPAAPRRRPLEDIVTFIGEDSNIAMESKEDRPKFQHCDMGSTLFNDVNLGGSTFTDINFYGVDISDANLSEGMIHDCNLSNLKIYDCNLDGMTIDGIEIRRLSNQSE